jgi:oligoendopeptidase F
MRNKPKAKSKKPKVKNLLQQLNKECKKVHKNYEDLFWISYMGDHSVDKRLSQAEKDRDAFRSNKKLYEETLTCLEEVTGKDQENLLHWKNFFEKYLVPKDNQKIKDEIMSVESRIRKRRTDQKEGFISPYSGKFVEASSNKMRTIMRTDEDEKIRKACFDSLEKLAPLDASDYIKLVEMRNAFATNLGYRDFYDYKIQVEEGMTKEELFKIFDEVYESGKKGFTAVRKMEEGMLGLRKAWNKAYMLSGDFTKEEDPYFQFEDALLRWGRSFQALSATFRKATLTLDFLDRKGKWNNGFCHWPEPVNYENRKRLPGSSNFTTNVVPGQVGSGEVAFITLFHEGGHAVHYLNSTQTQICLNTEYPPASTAWAETQSMFMDSISSSIEWRRRYAKDKDGNLYPFDLYERKLKKLHKLKPLSLMSIMMVANFEREVYSTKGLTKQKLFSIAKKHYKKFTDNSTPSLSILNVPHIYSWSSACSYHAYGLATLAVDQWREYFYNKYGHIVDNPKVGKEMKKVWELASSKTFAELVVLATGKKLSAAAHVKEFNRSLDKTLKLAKERIKKLGKVRMKVGQIDLDAEIRMVHGKKLIADNRKGFEKMALTYANWFKALK